MAGDLRDFDLGLDMEKRPGNREPLPDFLISRYSADPGRQFERLFDEGFGGDERGWLMWSPKLIEKMRQAE